MSHFDGYGKFALDEVTPLVQNGRYIIQEYAEKRIFLDVVEKLKPFPSDRLLDIGCGLGAGLIPLSALVGKAIGCDHPNVIRRLRRMIDLPHIELAEGDFLDVVFEERFTKIICYSVLPCLPSRQTLYAFIDKALSLLELNGRMLLGDLVNSDRKARFASSARGEAFQKQWDMDMHQVGPVKPGGDFGYSVATEMDDRFILDIVSYIRARGFDAFLVPQMQDLPFGNTREDILVVGPEYKD